MTTDLEFEGRSGEEIAHMLFMVVKEGYADDEEIVTRAHAIITKALSFCFCKGFVSGAETARKEALGDTDDPPRVLQ
jgi:hypothetical protein